VEAAVRAAARGDEALAREVIDRLPAAPTDDLLAAVLSAMSPGGNQPTDRDRLNGLLDQRIAPPALPKRTIDRPQPPPCQDIDPAALGKVVAAAVDPTVPRPLIVDRVLATLPGIKDLRPLALEPELDLPLWSFLKDNAPDWLLPGVGQMPPHSVAPLATNPAFVEALLVGANDQAAAEMRWRRHPLKAKASPLRKFWQRAGGQFDINPIKDWSSVEPFGDASLAFGGVGRQAVAVFRTPLFKRYPHTVVYMYPATVLINGDWSVMGLETITADKCVHSTFTGMVGDDVVFFGFPLDASRFADHWIVLEELPAGYRFYNVQPPGKPIGDAPPVVWPMRDSASDSGTYGFDSFALPVRAMIGNLLAGLV
jgi:hypothetical protein